MKTTLTFNVIHSLAIQEIVMEPPASHKVLRDVP